MWIANRKECHRIEKLTELLEVTPEILVDDDEVSEIENQRFFIETSRQKSKNFKEVSKNFSCTISVKFAI